MTEHIPPKAFISHASDDKERFVNNFAVALRQFGIDVWLDRWEMQPGDSLVDRIFEEGLKNADAVIVVLSATSVTKPWVREELNAAFIERIERNCKLIPVVIDECEIPACLKSTLWVRFKSLSDIREQTQQIANTIHGLSEKPPIGPPPKAKAISVAFDMFTDLYGQDRVVLGTACQLSFEGTSRVVSSDDLLQRLSDTGLTSNEIEESLRILSGRSQIKVAWVVGGGFAYVDVSISTLDEFLRSTEDDYELNADRIAIEIVNHERRGSIDIAEATGIRQRLVRHFLDMMRVRRLIDTVATHEGDMLIISVSPELPRLFRE
jgi:hypothetical protein